MVSMSVNPVSRNHAVKQSRMMACRQKGESSQAKQFQVVYSGHCQLVVVAGQPLLGTREQHKLDIHHLESISINHIMRGHKTYKLHRDLPHRPELEPGPVVGLLAIAEHHMIVADNYDHHNHSAVPLVSGLCHSFVAG
jgi:hypothetical protein